DLRAVRTGKGVGTGIALVVCAIEADRQCGLCAGDDVDRDAVVILARIGVVGVQHGVFAYERLDVVGPLAAYWFVLDEAGPDCSGRKRGTAAELRVARAATCGTRCTARAGCCLSCARAATSTRATICATGAATDTCATAACSTATAV